MTTVTLIRHGPTRWNLEGRIQGRRDMPLDDHGRRAVAQWRLPAALGDAAWYVSPLARARDTAEALGIVDARVEPRLAEMDWGEWEGERLTALRERLGEGFRCNESRGLDFLPPGGESPRMVMERVRSWLIEVAASGDPSAAITHKGVIRAVFADATGWDMRGPPPQRLHWSSAHAFRVDRRGNVTAGKLNIDLVPARAATGGTT